MTFGQIIQAIRYKVHDAGGDAALHYSNDQIIAALNEAQLTLFQQAPEDVLRPLAYRKVYSLGAGDTIKK